jgi:hypothetical protein
VLLFGCFEFLVSVLELFLVVVGRGKGSSPVEFNWIGAGPFILKGKIVKKLFLTNF